MTLIGLGGRLQNGKDVVADRLVAEHGFIKMGMSDPLNAAMMTLNPIVRYSYQEDGYIGYAEIVDRVGYTDAKKIPEVRRLLQVFGTEVVRNMFGENVWVDLARKRILEMVEDNVSVVLTGIRFENELNLIHSLGGETWWVERPGFPVGSTNSHASEDTLTGDQFQTQMINNRDVAFLEKLVDKVITS